MLLVAPEPGAVAKRLAILPVRHHVFAMLTDRHYGVLELLKAGQPLITKRLGNRTIAKIGPERVSIDIVADLERANMIRSVENRDDQTRYFEFVKDIPDPELKNEPWKARLPRMRRDDARRQIIAAWHRWWASRQILGKTATDADAHAFLKELRSEQPLLFGFVGKQPSYEVAFSWLIEAGVLAHEKSRK